MKKNTKFIIIGLSLLVLFVLILSLCFYQIFSNKKPSIVSNLEVSFIDRGEVVVDPEELRDPSLVQPYQFTIINKGDDAVKYKIVLQDNSKDKNGIARKNVKYELTLNKKIIQSGSLNQIEDDILDTRVISLQGVNSYSLKVWIDYGDDLEDKSYNYSLKVMTIAE